MGNGQPTKTGSVSAKKADTSAGSTLLPELGSMPLGASTNSSETTTATTLNASRRTSKKVDYSELKSKAGLVAGALADFQSAGGIVVQTRKVYETASGSRFTAVKLFLVVENADIVAVKTADGLEFDIVEK